MNVQLTKSHLEVFMQVYAAKLEQAHKDNPADYAWSFVELPNVLARMESAVMRGSFNKDSNAFKETCKQLRVKHTYKAIKAFIERGERI